MKESSVEKKDLENEAVSVAYDNERTNRIFNERIDKLMKNLLALNKSLKPYVFKEK